MEKVARLSETRVDREGRLIPFEAAIFSVECVGQVESLAHPAHEALLNECVEFREYVSVQLVTQIRRANGIGVACFTNPIAPSKQSYRG